MKVRKNSRVDLLRLQNQQASNGMMAVYTGAIIARQQSDSLPGCLRTFSS